ncbi:MAG: hypothetical protein R2724_11215 [Bryobacterales bacterium]
MNIPLLDFGEPAPRKDAQKDVIVARNPLIRTDASLERVVETFEAMQAREGSPITAIRRMPAREAETATLPEAVDPRLRRVLAERGIERLYSHQAEAYEKIAAGKNVVIVTPTASGKTLC